MPFLSRIPINPRRAVATGMVDNPHVVHGMVLAAQPVERGRTLWRWESPGTPRPHLLVLTADRPDWTHVVEQAGWPDAEGAAARVADYAPVLGAVRPGAKFGFRLTANPVQSRRKPDAPTENQQISADNRRGFRMPHRTPKHQLTWLLERAGQWGFRVPPTDDAAAIGYYDDERAPDVRVVDRQVLRFRKQRSTPQVTLTTACFEGHLVVDDPQRLTDTLLSGAGPAKAYGCGLLTLAPV